MKIVHSILSWLITLLLPLALSFLGLRLLLTHTFLEIEYHLPGFPPDVYGFSLADRLHWGGIAVDYLQPLSSVRTLANLTFPDGSSLFNDRELAHMQDVRNVTQAAMAVGYADWLVVLVLGLWAKWGGWWQAFLAGIRRGGWLTFGLSAVIGILASVNFWEFFTIFHSLFFTGNSWLFLTSDTLIRLFPLPFWEIAFGLAGVINLGGGLALGLALKPSRVNGV
jgi:integral membrane protein (TIGR01906 family)